MLELAQEKLFCEYIQQSDLVAVRCFLSVDGLLQRLYFCCRWDEIKSKSENQIHLLQLLEIQLGEGQKHHFSRAFKHKVFAIYIAALPRWKSPNPELDDLYIESGDDPCVAHFIG